MKLNKKQRHMVYMLMLAELRNYKWSYENSDGFCFMAFHIFGIQNKYGMYGEIIEHVLPELNNKRPNDILSNGLWFKPNDTQEGRAERIKLLKKCIEETYYEF